MDKIEPEKARALKAASILLDGRDPFADVSDFADIAIGLELLISVILLSMTDNDSYKAQLLLHGVIVGGVEGFLEQSDGLLDDDD